MKKYIIPSIVIVLFISSSFVGVSKPVEKIAEPPQTVDGPMDSPWPMYCHDTRHTGRSPYSTTHIVGNEKWRYRVGFLIHGSGVIDDENILYFGSWDDNIYALYSNGTLKWEYDIGGNLESSPAIDDDGIIYAGIDSVGAKYLDAIYPNGTRKWRYHTNGENVWSSPSIGNDGTIYFGGWPYEGGGHIHALYPNGTLKWKFKTNDAVLSSPAIDDSGIIYCGSHDCNLYALYPNGTLKWKFPTGHWIRTSPCIADDGTIYCVSLDDYLYAIYPNGTMKWKTSGCAGTSPTIGQDGTIYCGYNKLKALYPQNGSIKWEFDPGPNRTIRGATPCNSIDGTIYFGTSDGGEIISVNSNGIENWRKSIGECEFAPIIAEDGTIYVGACYTEFSKESGKEIDYCYLYAFGLGGEKKIEIESPEPGNLYLFGNNICPTFFGKTRIVGDITIEIKTYSEEELEDISFYIDDTLMFTDTQAPYEWTLAEKLDTWGFGWHTLKVMATYKGGCEWTEEMDFWFFHL